MTIRHDQFLQDITSLELMFGSLGALRKRMPTMHREWYAAMASGPIGQIREIQAEMHEYLELPYPAPAVALSPDADAPPRIARSDDYNHALETLCRLYRALGGLRLELGQFRPLLCATLTEQFLPQLHAVQTAMHTYLELAAVEATLAELGRRFADLPPTDPAAPAPDALPVAEEKV